MTWQTSGKWFFIIPIERLYLSDAIGMEFRIKRVLLVQREKLPRIRKRLGLQHRFSERKKLLSEVLEKDNHFSNCLALVPVNGDPKGQEGDVFRVLYRELTLLALSQLGFGKRHNMHTVDLTGNIHPSPSEYFCIHESCDRILRTSRETMPHPLAMDTGWLLLSRVGFFDKFMRIIKGEIKTTEGWRNLLEKIGILLGQSINATNIPRAFLYDFIALETLLKKDGDRIEEDVPLRVEAFFGWLGAWSIKNFKAKFHELYRLRNNLVHQGRFDEIGLRHLIFLDDLLFNLLVNLVNYHELFPSKEAIIAFSEKVQAEKVLGLKSKVRPKKFRFFQNNYRKEDYEAIW
jgi:hypothetical protein